jgi:hypothetical protein
MRREPGIAPRRDPSPLVSLARAEASLPGPTRVHLMREHWRRMRQGVEEGDQEQADRCQRAMAWAEHQLGLR